MISLCFLKNGSKGSSKSESCYDSLFLSKQEMSAASESYVTSAPPEAIVRDLAAGPHKLYGIGPALAWEYLRNVGIGGVKPDIHVCRFLGADHMGESEQEQAGVSEAVAIVRKMSEQLHLPMVEIDSILWSYCASHYGEICTATPHCDTCVVRKFCTRKEVYG